MVTGVFFEPYAHSLARIAGPNGFDLVWTWAFVGQSVVVAALMFLRGFKLCGLSKRVLNVGWVVL